eukprot:TRINITY_DN3995_c0_g2_i3.p1 TRINITY_DN3995_c0_g2~~TRINITY_DN3995_c0_g2_i3.p1  ORF type:complete len:563 (+),score=140.56 TRINITY_DN3995_c0_g2_i3:66-1754(+)
MLDHFTIFTLGGLVLWSQSWGPKLRGSPVNELIKTVFLEERGGTENFEYGSYSVKWTRDNNLGLFFVAVFQTVVRQVGYIDLLLEAVKKAFIKFFVKENKQTGADFTTFDEKFESLMHKAHQVEEEKKEEPKKVPRPFHETKRGMEIAASATSTTSTPTPPTTTTTIPNPTANQEGPRRPGPIGSPPTVRPVLNDVKRPRQLKRPGRKAPTSPEPKKVGKAPQKWGENTSSTPPARLNWGEDAPPVAQRNGTGAENFGAGETLKLEFTSSSTSSSASSEDEGPPASGLFSFFTNLTNKQLTDADVDPLLTQFKTSLITKNVAKDITDQLCESVKNNLIGKRLGTFSRVSTAVQEGMEQALTRILTPKRTIDILRDIRLSKASGRPYVIVFVGVNGVGKSTSLAKVCSWLQQNQQKVMIAACDTWRSGAIEQLGVHAQNLGVELYHQGYGKSGKDDATAVANKAIKKATDEKFDVVLVDTSGRMQGNVKLMKELSTLVGFNKPDLVLFVGEALAGNDSVDQLVNFNRSLEEYSTTNNAHGIDGIILTKVVILTPFAFRPPTPL